MATARSGFRPRCLWPPLLAAALAAAAGCGPGTYPVAGKLVWKDGSPVTQLAGGTVIFESTEKRLGARGEVGADGTFVLGTYKPGDGIPPGKYRVAVVAPPLPDSDGPAPRVFDPKFEDPKTSGLEVTIERKKNEPVLTLERFTGKGRRR